MGDGSALEVSEKDVRMDCEFVLAAALEEFLEVAEKDVKADCESVLAAVPKEFLAWEVGAEDVKVDCKFVLSAVPKAAWQTIFEFILVAVLGECLALEVAEKDV